MWRNRPLRTDTTTCLRISSIDKVMPLKSPFNCLWWLQKKEIYMRTQTQIYRKIYAVDIRYFQYHSLESSLCRNFYLVPTTFSLTPFGNIINPFGISNSAISNFHYVKQFSRSIQSFLGCIPSAIPNIRMRFSNESYCLFQAFEC